MFNKLLIANRGEIACRIIKTAKRLGVATVAVYSDADRNALHVSLADEAIHLGPPPAKDSYLLADKILQAAVATGSDAIHPGYGFLSENAAFARACEQSNICFVGPPASAIDAMGSKSAAKDIMGKAKVPLVPGYHGDDQNPELLRSEAEKMGYPVLLKATAGGGGKGMRQVWAGDEFDEALAAAKRESLASFGDDTMLVEKYLTKPRHVEVQVFCDNHGNAVYLAERDCSVQRRHQKVIEEAPAPGMTEELRQKMGDAAVKSALAIDYRGAGTVEFLLDEDGSFYFMEMNTRLQVEHPVTEMITGQDLVEWQLQIACDAALPLQQNEVKINGHAFEARIYAEDTDNDFLPATGVLEYLRTPQESEHLRIDTGVREGDEISVYYDPMIAKLIVWDRNRALALKRLNAALAEFHIGGTVTNVNFLHQLASTEPFANAELDTGFIEKHKALIFPEDAPGHSEQIPLMAISLLLYQRQQSKSVSCLDPWSPWQENDAWQLNTPNRQAVHFKTGDTEHHVIIEQHDGHFDIHHDGEITAVHATLNGDELAVDLNGHRIGAALASTSRGFILYLPESSCEFTELKPDTGVADGEQGHSNLAAPMNGTVVALLVEVGAEVEKGKALLVMEAMKMEQTIRAPQAGTVNAFYYQVGDLVDGGAELVDFQVKEEG